MITFDLKLRGTKLHGADNIIIASYTNKGVELKFDFDEEWQKYPDKVAVFERRYTKPVVMEIKDSKCSVPWNILSRRGGFFISVVGYKNSTVLTTAKEWAEVKNCPLPPCAVPKGENEDFLSRIRAETEQEAESKYERQIKSLNVIIRTLTRQLKSISDDKESLQAELDELNEKYRVLKEKYDELEHSIHIDVQPDIDVEIP